MQGSCDGYDSTSYDSDGYFNDGYFNDGYYSDPTGPYDGPAQPGGGNSHSASL